jgi:hypothetical protein
LAAADEGGGARDGRKLGFGGVIVRESGTIAGVQDNPVCVRQTAGDVE